MTPPIDPRRRQELLDALLAEPSQEWAASMRSHAVAEFTSAQRRRRIVRALAQATAIAAAAVAGFAWWAHSTPKDLSRNTIAAVPAVVRPPATVSPPSDGIPAITEAEMLAMFPQNSCVVAEIDGQRRLVFLDDEIKHHGADYPLPSL